MALPWRADFADCGGPLVAVAASRLRDDERGTPNLWDRDINVQGNGRLNMVAFWSRLGLVHLRDPATEEFSRRIDNRSIFHRVSANSGGRRRSGWTRRPRAGPIGARVVVVSAEITCRPACRRAHFPCAVLAVRTLIPGFQSDHCVHLCQRRRCLLGPPDCESHGLFSSPCRRRSQ